MKSLRCELCIYSVRRGCVVRVNLYIQFTKGMSGSRGMVLRGEESSMIVLLDQLFAHRPGCET
jgi:hypothetical protein